MNVLKKHIKRRTAEALSGYAFLAPWLIGLVFLSLFPFLYSFWISICSVSFTTNGIVTKLVGLKWYREAFTEDTTFLISLLDTVKFVAFSTPIIIVSSLIIALMLNSQFRFRGFFRAVFFFPVIITSGPVISELVVNRASAIINPERFPIYTFVEQLPAVISLPVLYIFDNIVIILWFSGVQILIYVSRLQKIGRPIYEAAAIDGASDWQVFWKILLPFIKPTIFLNAIYTIMELSSFSNNAINSEISSKMTLTGKAYSYSAAMSWIYFLAVVVLLLIIAVVLRARARRGDDEN